MDRFNNRLFDLSTLRFLKADPDKPQPNFSGFSSVDKMEGGCAAVVRALSTPPGTSSSSLHLPAELPTPVTVSSSPPPPNVPVAAAQLLLDFPGVVNPSKQLPAAVHDVQHHIKTIGPPLASRFRHLEGAKLQAARAEFDQMEKDGIVHRSTSPWASPLRMVPKKDGSWRPCGDFRRLHLMTESDRFLLLNMPDFADWLSGCTVFPKLI